ncbi:hypothetical protein SSX86_024799 [Deinandra increscens subsp. villosa]|uniref:Uncharacterized protein n=1 Tax=Deinandra increscens subsp. villosa TaxID=3103831 RepID=A0AAP0CC65_9ASTR
MFLNESELHGRQLKVAGKQTNVSGMKQFKGRRPAYILGSIHEGLPCPQCKLHMVTGFPDETPYDYRCNLDQIVGEMLMRVERCQFGFIMPCSSSCMSWSLAPYYFTSF